MRQIHHNAPVPPSLPPQLIASGVLDVREYPTFDEESGQGLLASSVPDGEEEEFEIDINDAEPTFLKVSHGVEA